MSAFGRRKRLARLQRSVLAVFTYWLWTVAAAAQTGSDGCLDESTDKNADEATARAEAIENLQDEVTKAKARTDDLEKKHAEAELSLSSFERPSNGEGTSKGIEEYAKLTLAEAKLKSELDRALTDRQIAEHKRDVCEAQKARLVAKETLSTAAQDREDALDVAGDNKDLAQLHMEDARAKVSDANKDATALRKKLEQLQAKLQSEKGKQQVLLPLVATLEAEKRDNSAMHLLTKPSGETAIADARTDAALEVARAELADSQRLQASLEKAIANLEQPVEDLEQEVTEGEVKNRNLNDAVLDRIALKNGDEIAYGVTLAAARLRVTRSSQQDARVRDYQPEAEFVPSLIGFRVVYGPNATPWRIRTSGKSLQLISIEFPLYLEKADGSALAAVSFGVGLTLVDGLIGFGVAFDVYRAIPVKGGTAKIGVLPWALSRKSEVTAENVALMLTLGLDTIVEKLSGSTTESRPDQP